MSRTTRKALVAAAIGVSALAAAAGPAWAAGSPAGTSSQNAALTAIKAKASAAISGRVSALQSTISAVNVNGVLTSGDKTALLGILNGDVAGLSALAPRIQADPTAAQATTDYRSIFLNYRVYALALPQVRLAAATDDITGGVLPRLTDAQSRLSSMLSGADAAKDTAAVKAEMSNLASQIQSVTSATNGLSATVLAYTPAQYDANHALLSTPRQTLLTARADIAAARLDIQSLLAAVR
jgi:hypothetical protein